MTMLNEVKKQLEKEEKERKEAVKKAQIRQVLAIIRYKKERAERLKLITACLRSCLASLENKQYFLI